MSNRLAHAVLGRSLDELPPQTRRLLLLLDKMAAEACARLEIERAEYRFSRREVRAYTGWSNTALKVHMQRLEELEYLLVHRGVRGQSFVFELVYDGEGKDGAPFVCGLIDLEKLGEKHAYDEKWSGQKAGWSGQNGERSGSSQPQVRGVSGLSQGDENGAEPHGSKAGSTSRVNGAENAYLGAESAPKSYVPISAPVIAMAARSR